MPQPDLRWSVQVVQEELQRASRRAQQARIDLADLQAEVQVRSEGCFGGTVLGDASTLGRVEAATVASRSAGLLS